MSDTLIPTPPDNTVVPPETQQQLREYWQTFGPYAGVITLVTVWDGGTTEWDDGATIWPS